jgi:hypothetical protein
MWNPEEQIKSMQPAVDKLVTDLKKQGIGFLTDADAYKDVTANNVVFYKSGSTGIAFISYHSFYRFSGISVITRDKKGENNQSETIPVTNDQYMQVFMKPIILTLLEA